MRALAPKNVKRIPEKKKELQKKKNVKRTARRSGRAGE
jgi:hypothetical protein